MNCKGCLIFGTALLLITLLTCGTTMMMVGRFLVSTDSPAPADAIVVLGGDTQDFTRVQQAVRLFRQGYAPTAVFVSASSKNGNLGCSPLQQTLEVAQELGLPTSATITVNGARSTYDEAMYLRKLTRQHDWHSLIIVTDMFHTRRAGRTFRTLLPDVTIYVTAAPNPDYDVRRWWQTEGSLVFVFSEVIKLAFYWVKYGIAPVGI